jgi:mRNA-degrading endonuclease RelE of RelBE toxin-antitoxin system
MYRLCFAQDTLKDMRRIPAFHRMRIVEAIEAQLTHEPLAPSRNKKLLANLMPPWHAEPPIWELRVGDYRVFYDVAEAEKIVYIRAVRLKPHGLTTGDII